MIKPMKMHCRLRVDNGVIIASATLFDGTPFEVQVEQHDVILNEALTGKPVDGWLNVKQHGEQEDRRYVTLPKGSINFGHEIIVNKYTLMPLHATLSDFNPKTF